MNQQQTIIDNIRRQERSATEMLTFQKEVTDRFWMYRTLGIIPRQPADVETCRVFEQWLHRFYLGEI